jgi:hypothetical protein
MLAEAQLGQANLSAADLTGINLTDANLENANLSWASLVGANLANANLAGANLEGADLSGANLIGANLKAANLAKTYLFQAQLDEYSKNFALRSGAIFSPEEFQAYSQSLVPIQTISNSEEDLLEEEPTIFIESAEGEPMLPEFVYSDTRDDYDYDYDSETALIEDSEPEKAVFSDDEDDAGEGEDTVLLDDSALDNTNE